LFKDPDHLIEKSDTLDPDERKCIPIPTDPENAERRTPNVQRPTPNETGRGRRPRLQPFVLNPGKGLFGWAAKTTK
jgi:hypothetical protein